MKYLTPVLAILFCAVEPYSSLCQPLNSQYINSDGVMLHYVDVGEGEPVVLIHGFSDSIEECYRQPLMPDSVDFIAALAKKYRVIAIDARGHGKSDKPGSVESYGLNMMEDVTRLMRHLNIVEAHLVGYSMGAFIAGNLAVSHPEMVKSAVLIGGTPLTNLQYSDNHPLIKVLKETATSLAVKNNMNPLLEYFWPGQGPASEAYTLDSLSGTILGGQSLPALSSCIMSLNLLNQVDANLLMRNSVPVKIIIGQDDPMNDFLSPFVKMPYCSVIQIPTANHFDILLYPECLQAVENFLYLATCASGESFCK